MSVTTVAVYGGSFDPPHVGHVLAAAYVLSVHAVDRVLAVPVFRHPFHKELTPFADRVAMTELAMAPLAGVEVSTIESELGGESRTVYTLEALKRRAPDCQLRLVIGADVLEDRAKWYRFDRIAELAPPLVLGRAGITHPEAPPAVLPQVSSTAIRAALRRGDAGSVAPLLPAAVARYIAERGLYSGGA